MTEAQLPPTAPSLESPVVSPAPETKPGKTITIEDQKQIIVLHVIGIKPVKVEYVEGRMIYHFEDKPELHAATSKLGLEGPEAFPTTMDKVFAAYSSWTSNLARFKPRVRNF